MFNMSGVSLLKGNLHRALPCFVTSSPILAPGSTAMALLAATALSFSTSTSLLTLFSVFASASTSLLLGAWAATPAATSPLPLRKCAPMKSQKKIKKQ